MAKRFTDTDKWKKPFIKSLPMEYKIFWLYLLDDCDHAGLWHVDFEVAEIRLGTKLSQKKAEGFFSERIVLLDNGSKWFIPDFIRFQYGELSEKNRAHLSVLNVLRRYDLLKFLNEFKEYTCPLEGVKDKDKDKEMDKYILKDGTEGNFNTMPKPEDCGQLPEITVGSVIELIRITKGQTVTAGQVKGLWPVFLAQHATGKKYYQNVEAVYSHFINWIRTQNFENGKENAKPRLQTGIYRRNSAGSIYGNEKGEGAHAAGL